MKHVGQINPNIHKECIPSFRHCDSLLEISCYEDFRRATNNNKNASMTTLGIQKDKIYVPRDKIPLE